MNLNENQPEEWLADALRRGSPDFELSGNAHLVHSTKTRIRHKRRVKAGALSTIAAVALGSAAIAPSLNSRVVADPSPSIGVYSSFAQTLPGFGAVSSDTDSAQIARDFAKQVLGVEATAVRVDSSSSTISEVFELRSDRDSRPFGWIGVTNYSRDPRTALEPVQHPFVVAVSSVTTPDGHLRFGDELLLDSNLYQAQASGGYRLATPAWDGCAGSELSLRTWAGGGSQVVASERITGQGSAVLAFDVTEPVAAFALAQCFAADGSLIHVSARPVGLLPKGTVPREVRAVSGDSEISIVLENDRFGSEGATQLFARTYQGVVEAFGKSVSATVFAGVGLPSPTRRCGQIRTEWGGAKSVAGLTTTAVCAVEASDGTHAAFIEFKPGVVMMLTDTHVDPKNHLTVSQLNRVIEAVSLEVNY